MALTAEQAYALSKKYTKSTAEEFGALKGAPCTIQSIVDIDGGHRITFSWENSQGQTLTDTVDLMDGESPEIVVKESTGSTYILHIKTADGEFDTPNLKGSNGNTFEVDENGVLHITSGGSGGGGSAELQDDLTAHLTVGGTTSGETFNAGTPLETIFRDMLDPVMYPTLTNPSVSLSATGAKLLEKGATLNTTFTANFNRGSINPAYGTSGYRSGEAIDYSLNGGTAQSGNTWSVVVDETTTQYQATVNYAEGEQPKDSAGNDYSTPLPSGSVTSSKVIYEFVNALYANTSDITVVAKQALISKSTKVKEFSFPSQTVSNPEVFDVPSDWNITAIEMLNTLNNQWEDCSSEFTVTATTHDDASGTSVNYNRYTDNRGYSAGERKVRIKWS